MVSQRLTIAITFTVIALMVLIALLRARRAPVSTSEAPEKNRALYVLYALMALNLAMTLLGVATFAAHSI